jgi:hypothetical protein
MPPNITHYIRNAKRPDSPRTERVFARKFSTISISKYAERCHTYCWLTVWGLKVLLCDADKSSGHNKPDPVTDYFAQKAYNVDVETNAEVLAAFERRVGTIFAYNIRCVGTGHQRP